MSWCGTVPALVLAGLLANTVLRADESTLADLPNILVKAPAAALRFGVINPCNDPRVFWPVVAASKRPVLVVFTTSHCVVCRQQRPLLERFVALRPDILVLDVDADDAVDIAIRHGVAAVPYLVIYRNGAVLAVSASGKTDDALEAWCAGLGFPAPAPTAQAR